MGLERGASSNCQHLDPPPPATVQDLQVYATQCLQTIFVQMHCLSQLAVANTLTKYVPNSGWTP